jgi:Tol biopolymer transport system component
VFSRDLGETTALRSIDLATGEETAITRDSGVTDWWPAYSPDGTHIVFARAGPGLEPFSIRVVDLESGLVSPLAPEMEGKVPAWRP